jgi:hypothetical protein
MACCAALPPLQEDVMEELFQSEIVDELDRWMDNEQEVGSWRQP